MNKWPLNPVICPAGDIVIFTRRIENAFLFIDVPRVLSEDRKYTAI